MQSLADSLPGSQLHLCGRVCHLHRKDSVSAGNPPEGCDEGREEPWTYEEADDTGVEPISPQRLRGGGDVAIPDGGVAAMRMADLQRALRERNLTTRGGKADLVVRLQEALDRDKAGGGGMKKRSMSPSADSSKQKVAYQKKKKKKGPIETKQGIELLKVRPVLNTQPRVLVVSSPRCLFAGCDAFGSNLWVQIRRVTRMRLQATKSTRSSRPRLTLFALRMLALGSGCRLSSTSAPPLILLLIVQLVFLNCGMMKSLIEHGQVFSEDIAATGAKHYVVATYAGFWRMYKRLSSGSKHFGEVIREGNACRLYFDLEFPIEEGEDVAAAHSTGNERYA
jgi:hypothetical protein